MTDKERRQQRRSAEDAAFNKMLCGLVAAIAAEAVVLLVKRFYIDITGSRLELAIGLSRFFQVFIYAGLALTVLGIVWCAAAWKGHKKLTLPVSCTAAVGFLWLLSVLAYFLNDVGVKIMMVLPAAAAVLLLIFFLYQRAFFFNAIVTGCGMAALWGCRQFYAAHPRAVAAAFILGWIALAVIALLALRVKKSGGRLGRMTLVSSPASYAICWLTCAVVALSMLAGFLLGTGSAYVIFVLIGWLFCLAVYFTVKLM